MGLKLDVRRDWFIFCLRSKNGKMEKCSPSVRRDVLELDCSL